MHRVELIVEIVNERSADILDRVARGNNIAVSMGCKVPWDECSECGNKAKNRNEYCEHLRRGTAGRVQSNGRKPYAINWQPKFFDISFVTIPADPTASVLAKVASLHVVNDAPFANAEHRMDELLKQSGLKHADIIKRVDGNVEGAASDPKGLIPRLQDPMPIEEIRDLTRRYSLNDILSTLLAMRIMPKKQDFQRLVLHSMGRAPLAEQLDSQGFEFPVDSEVSSILPADVSPHLMNQCMAREYAHWIPQRSLTKPLIVLRMIEKVSSMTEPQMVNSYGRDPEQISMETEAIRVPQHLQRRLVNSKDESEQKVISEILQKIQTRHPSGLEPEKLSSLRTICGDTIKVAEPQADPDPKVHKKLLIGHLGKPTQKEELGKVAEDGKGGTPPKGGGTTLKGGGAAGLSAPPAAGEQISVFPGRSIDQKSSKGRSSFGKPTRKEELGKISEYLQKKAFFGKKEETLPAGPMAAATPQGPVDKNPFFAITGLGALYVGFQRLMDMGASKDIPKLERTIIQNPWMLPLLAGTVGLATVAGSRAMHKESAYIPERAFMRDPGMLKSIIAATVPSYLYSGHQEVKVQRGEQIDEFGDFVRKHPFLTSVGTLAALRGGVKALTKKASSEDILSHMTPDQINSLYNDIISYDGLDKS